LGQIKYRTLEVSDVNSLALGNTVFALQ
jgi:hypothetical protein